MNHADLNEAFQNTRQASADLHDTIWRLAAVALIERDRYRDALIAIGSATKPTRAWCQQQARGALDVPSSQSEDR
jgi:hypothetical protein